jgi:hypothetical protein
MRFLRPDVPGGTHAGSQNKSHLFRDLEAVLILLVLGDGILTEYVVRHSLGREANPFVSLFMQTDSLIRLKALGALICVLMLWDISRRQPRVALLSCCVCVAVYTLILYWNLAVAGLSAF